MMLRVVVAFHVSKDTCALGVCVFESEEAGLEGRVFGGDGFGFEYRSEEGWGECFLGWSWRLRLAAIVRFLLFFSCSRNSLVRKNRRVGDRRGGRRRSRARNKRRR